MNNSNDKVSVQLCVVKLKLITQSILNRTLKPQLETALYKDIVFLRFPLTGKLIFPIFDKTRLGIYVSFILTRLAILRCAVLNLHRPSRFFSFL